MAADKKDEAKCLKHGYFRTFSSISWYVSFFQIFFCLTSWNVCFGMWGHSEVARRPVVARAKAVAKVRPLALFASRMLPARAILELLATYTPKGSAILGMNGPTLDSLGKAFPPIRYVMER